VWVVGHHRAKKGETDVVDAVGHVPLRYMVAFMAPIGITIRRFLEEGGLSSRDVEGMWVAWIKRWFPGGYLVAPLC